jgi:hypothetical protein
MHQDYLFLNIIDCQLKGVFRDSECRTVFQDDPKSQTLGADPEVNHALLLVGYGTDPDYGEYWLAKNSFGTDWGENGFVRIARNQGLYGMCNLAAYAYYPSIKSK